MICVAYAAPDTAIISRFQHSSDEKNLKNLLKNVQAF